MTRLRALTVQQPYADALGYGAKDVDNRTRRLPLRPGERLAIHAAKTIARPGFDTVRAILGTHPDWLAATPHRLGAIVALATYTDCHHADDHPDDDADFPFLMDTDDGWQCSSWAQPAHWHHHFTDPLPLSTPVPCRGRLGVWIVPDAVAALLPLP